MLLKLYSIEGDLLELSTDNVYPHVNIVEIFYDGAYHPWHPIWEPLRIEKFNEDFDTVVNKVVEYYKAEKTSCTLENGTIVRRPGHAVLLTDFGEEWSLGNCKVSKFDVDENNKSVLMELSFDEVCYKANRGNV